MFLYLYYRSTPLCIIFTQDGQIFWKGVNIFKKILLRRKWIDLLKFPRLNGYLRIKDVLANHPDNTAYILTTEQVFEFFPSLPDSKRSRQFEGWFRKLNAGIIKICLCPRQRLQFTDHKRLYFETSDSDQAFTLQYLMQLYIQSKSDTTVSSTEDSHRPLDLQVCSVESLQQYSRRPPLDLQVCSVESVQQDSRRSFDLPVENHFSIEPPLQDSRRSLDLPVENHFSIEPPLQISPLDLPVENHFSIEPPLQDSPLNLPVKNYFSIEPPLQDSPLDLRVIKRPSIEPPLQDSPLDLQVIKRPSTISHRELKEQCVNTDRVTLLTETTSKSFQINDCGEIVKYSAFDITDTIPSGMHQPYTKWEDYKLYLYVPYIQSTSILNTQNFYVDAYNTDMILSAFENSSL